LLRPHEKNPTTSTIHVQVNVDVDVVVHVLVVVRCGCSRIRREKLREVCTAAASLLEGQRTLAGGETTGEGRYLPMRPGGAEDPRRGFARVRKPTTSTIHVLVNVDVDVVVHVLVVVCCGCSRPAATCYRVGWAKLVSPRT